MEIVYRGLDPKIDGDNVYKITKSSGFFEEKEILLAMKYFEEAKNGDADHAFLFAEINGQTVGYTNYGAASYTGKSYYLHWIAVDQDFRNRGIGKLLLFKTEELIKSIGGKKVFVETSSKEEYTATRYFYLSSGYQLEAVLKNFYSETDNQIILSKYL
ncbi:MAG: hypothetical protein A2086_01050 [Spirochaetes bacterium GWD1_27_9]|nr:MAG: hypothetical protein A2Z98_15980 [Spirochaetes bacterium GWB1_27_13]OHD22664.1 MAG: hypothetical protein A2Y34_15690 [Spirochaetes bacterium GWC1_27_15]OHD33640.1 MAG: hypothetical protein A2086_01050 [Spirochaetes bacterium GWD1_27_9]